MSAKAVMFSLPENLLARMRSSIPSRERSKLVATFLEKEINAREHALYLSAKKLEQCSELNDEMAAWEEQFGMDGLDDI